MKKQLFSMIACCVFASSVAAEGLAFTNTNNVATENLALEDAIGMGSLMICDVFYSDNEMPIQGAMVKKAVIDHQDAGIEDMIMSQETSDKLAEYIANFRSADKEAKMMLCNKAIEYARTSTIIN